jgi:hypothetical protein
MAGSAFCAVCGAQVDDPAEELRAVSYLLSELPRWESMGILYREQAAALRQSYERRRDELRARIESGGRQAEKTSAPSSSDARQPESTAQQPPPVPPHAHAPEAEATAHARATPPDAPDYAVAAAFSQFLSTSPALQAREQRPRRTLIETLAEPYTLRLLLYTGAAMLVVGIVIWLRDVLYLKLQEPVVQAALLALGTISVTASGWYTILRTRQRLTGRALTLIGSVLVPVNFWFLVRSGLIANTGRAWVVCAFCAMLYAHTAALLRERLYVYLACLASVATVWALVLRTTPGAFGLYALTLMGAALVFLHLSRLFPLERDTDKEANDSSTGEEERTNRNGVPSGSRFSYALWGPPLVFTALVGATLSALVYMPLRLWPSLSLYDGIFRLSSNVYDPSIAILLFAALAYVVWFTGRYIFTEYRVLLYTLSTLALFWTLIVTLDGLRLKSSAHLLALTAATLAICIASLIVRRSNDEASRALHFAGLLLSIVLATSPFGILFTDELNTMTHSAALACLALSFALLSTPRLSGGRLGQAALAHASAIFASLSFLTALGSASLRSETLFVAACAAWPFALYTCAQLARRREGAAQLTAPFVRIADAEFVLLFLWASGLALLLSLDRTLVTLRPAMFCALVAALLYGALRGARDHSVFGAALVSLAALVNVAAMLDALKMAGFWPGSWPIAAGLICAAFLIRKAAPGLLERKREGQVVEARPLDRVVSAVMDAAVLVCALLWFATAIYRIDVGGSGAAFVLLLALLYWIERAAQSRLASIAHLAAIHAGELFIALLVALRIETQWFGTAAALILFPLFFATARYARSRDAGWAAAPASMAAVVTIAFAFIVSLLHAAPHLQAGDPLLLAPLISVGAIALVAFGASLLSPAVPRVRYFRAGLSATVISVALGCLRAGFDPISDIEIYTSPVAILLLAIAYLSARRAWAEYDHDTGLLLWFGSLLLCVPLLFHALYFRLLLDVPALMRDLGTLCASLVLILFGALGRLRAPVLVGIFTLTLELASLTLTSVDWLQVPLKYYLVTVGALMLIVFWMFEYRSEQILQARKRFNQQRDYARERFGEWR